MLAQALSAANCIDVTGGIRYFAPQLKYVEGQGWRFVPRDIDDPEDDTQYLSIEEGVKREIPSYLVRSAVSHGGSGSVGPSTKDLHSRMNELRGQLEQLAALASRTGTSRDIARYQRAKRELAELEKQLKQTGA